MTVTLAEVLITQIVEYLAALGYDAMLSDYGIFIYREHVAPVRVVLNSDQACLVAYDVVDGYRSAKIELANPEALQELEVSLRDFGCHQSR